MVHKYDCMPGAVPKRVSDDQPVAIDLRSYVATGAEVTSSDPPAQEMVPPPQAMLPVRAEAELPQGFGGMLPTSPSLEVTADPGAEHPAAQSILRLCRLVDQDSTGLKTSDAMVLRGDIRTLAELTRFAEQCLDELQDSRSIGGPAKRAKKAKRRKSTHSKSK